MAKPLDPKAIEAERQTSSRAEKGHTVAKTVGVEEAGPRRPLLDFAERNFEIGAGSRRTGDGKNTDIKNKYFY